METIHIYDDNYYDQKCHYAGDARRNYIIF